MKIERLHEQPCMTLRRSSSAGQSDTSNANQLKNMEKVLSVNQMKIVCEIDLKGVSGSMPGNRTDVDDILARKKYINDFTFLILPSADRFTRAGALHGQKLLWDLAVAGIVVYFVQENIFSDSEFGRTILGFLFDAARQTAKQNSKGSTEGNTYSFKEGRSPHTRQIPYACDRLYLVGETRMHIIRNLADGSQEQWTPEEDPSERRLIQRFAPNPERGTRNHYHKQKNEIVKLIPGDPEHVKIVQHIMKRTWVDGIKGSALARELNDMGVPAPKGNRWSKTTCCAMPTQAVYIGLCIRGRSTAGIYHKLSPDGAPIEADRSLQELALRQRVQQHRRPRADWIQRYSPELGQMLPPEVKELAAEGIMKHLDRLAHAPLKLGRCPAEQSHSQYLLSGILWSKQGPSRMVGSGGRKPYYQTVTARSKPCGPRKQPITVCIPVAPLHAAVFQIVHKVLSDRPHLRDVVHRLLEEQNKRLDSFDVEAAQRRMKALRARQVVLTNRITGDAENDEAVLKSLHETDREVVALKIKIDANSDRIRNLPSADALVEQFVQESYGMEKMDRQTLKRLLKGMIKRMEVDLETREIEIDLTLPKWFVQKDLEPISSTEHLCARKGEHHKANDPRPNIFSFKMTNHGYGCKQVFKWEEVTTSPQIPPADPESFPRMAS